MSRPRPPDLEPDYRYLSDLEDGKGGFAQVYLYEQVSLGRKVAVKVLQAQGLRTKDYLDILDEARAMARLDAHQNIVQVYEARMSGDDQPCIIMMYCSGPNLWRLVQGGELDVRKVVRLGIDLAGAVQAAHSKGIIHRDIKPSNILTDEFDNPRLTDFGIAGTLSHAEHDRAFGVSVPWSPPEILEGGRGSIASDIYSLGATLHHLLAGHSPFALPGERDTEDDMVRRICTTSAPRLNRPVPSRLEDLILGMLSRQPHTRPRSAREVARQLQHIEQDEWGGPPPAETPWHVGGRLVPTTLPSHTGRGRTVLRSPAARVQPVARQPIEYQPVTQQPVVFPPAPAGVRGSTRSEPERTLLRAPAQPPVPPESPPRTRSSWWVWAAALVVVLGGVGAVIYAASRPSSDPHVADSRNVPASQGGTAGSVPAGQDAGVPGDVLPPGVPTVTATRVDEDTLRFSWTYSDPLDTDTFRWRTTDGEQSGVSTTPSVELPAPAGTPLCLQVKVVRVSGADANLDWSPEGCGS